MVILVMPTRCLTVARWLWRGRSRIADWAQAHGTNDKELPTSNRRSRNLLNIEQSSRSNNNGQNRCRLRRKSNRNVSKKRHVKDVATTKSESVYGAFHHPDSGSGAECRLLTAECCLRISRCFFHPFAKNSLTSVIAQE